MSAEAHTVIGLYRRHAQAWLRLRARHLIERTWLDRFIALLPPEPSVLDLGCGSGEPIARYLIEHGCRVTGIDAAPEMIAVAQRNCPDAAWQVADMRALAMAETFDGLLAWDSFFHLCQADQRRMFPIFRRHAAASAALMFTSGPAAGEAIGTFEGEPLYHASLHGSEYRDLLNRHGFDVMSHAVEDPDCGGHTVWLARMRP